MAEKESKVKNKGGTGGIKVVVVLLFGAALYEIYSRTPMFEKLNSFIREL